MDLISAPETFIFFSLKYSPDFSNFINFKVDNKTTFPAESMSNPSSALYSPGPCPSCPYLFKKFPLSSKPPSINSPCQCGLGLAKSPNV